MRRGRILFGIALLGAACSLGVARGALAATPQEVCAALQAGGSLSQFSQADQQAYANDPTIQGYGCSGTITPPVVTPCVEGGSGAGGSSSGGSGATPGSSSQCARPPCVES